MPAVHRCDSLLCPFGLTLGNEAGDEVEVSWTLRRGAELTFVTLADVLAAHPGGAEAAVDEHAVTLAEAARLAQAIADDRDSLPDVDLGARLTVENLADFAAELSEWCLASAGTVSGEVVWAAATAVMRAVMAMSSLTDVMDAGDPGA